MKALFGLVFFATGWGPTKGGINSFNFDLCCALGKQSESRNTKVFCICPGTTTEGEKREAENNNARLIDVDEKDFNNCKFDKILSEQIVSGCEIIFWFGHDVITAKQAFACRDKYRDTSKVVIFHHMNYGEYYAIGAPERTTRGEYKESEQKQVFQNADYAIAVGPKLFTSLYDIKTQSGSRAECIQIIPGLADITPIEKEMHKKIILFTGRLEKDNDPIKQYLTTIYAVSDLFKNRDVKLGEAELKLYGLDAETEDELNKKVEELKKNATNRAGCMVPIKPLAYTSNRKELFDAVKNSSIVIMPSISEGFGLAGYEGIAAGVPTIISKNSGLYEFLKAEHLECYISGIEVVGGDSWETPSDQDVENVYQAFKDILKNYARFKQNALILRQKILELGYSWDKTASDILDFLKIFKFNSFARLLSGVINSEINKEHSAVISEIASRFEDDFAQHVAEEFKTDKNSILSIKVEKFSDIPYFILSTVGVKVKTPFWSLGTIHNMVCDLLSRYCTAVIDSLKRVDKSDKVLRGLFITDTQSDTLKTAELDDESIQFLLHDHDKFHEDIIRILEEGNINAALSEQDLKMLKTYHKELKKTYDVLNFEGLSVMVSAGAQNIPLDRIYASMSLKSDSSELDFDFDFDFDLDDMPRIKPRDNANQLLTDRYNRIIIKGDPGSGKSTYLKKQLLTFCDSNRKHMCIFLKVSEFTKWITEDGGHPNQLSDYVYHILSTANAFCKEHKVELIAVYDKLKENGGISYFIDGLDEVQDSEQKKSINQKITEFVKDAEACKYILTSRKVGLNEEFFKSMDFAIKEIAPLSKSSIESYINNWYEVVGKIPGDTHHYYKQRARELIASIISQNNSQLLNLAGNPLLLTIIVILHHHGINPPTNRAMLYSEITKTLLVTWMERRNFEIKYPADYLNNFFSRVAFEIVTNGYSTMAISESKLKAMYAEYLSDSYEGDDGDKVESFIRYISDDAGILSPQGFLNNEKLYGFLMHRQIAEYYAALALENELELERIDFSSIIHESKWTEVSILMGGYMSMQAEAGQNRVNRYIKDLFKTKSKPIEDFKLNILLILEWISNSTFINKDNLSSLLKELECIFKSSNRYRVLQFCDDIVSALVNSQYRKQICKCLVNLIDEGDFIQVRNVSVVINALLKNGSLYRGIIEELTESRIIICLKQLIEHNDFYMLQRPSGCYHTLFMNYFIQCVNANYESSKGTDKEEIWKDYTYVYAEAVSSSRTNLRDGKSNNLIALLEQANENFSNSEILNEYIHSLVLYVIVFDIIRRPENATVDKNFLKTARDWGCGPLIESASHFINDEFSFGKPSSIYVKKGIRVFHKKDENGHKLTVFSYNRKTQELEKNVLFLKNDFCLEDLRAQISSSLPLTVYQCLDQLSHIEMPQEKLLELFNDAYDKGELLTEEDWHQSILEKISVDNEAFYKNYNTLKIWVKFDGKKTNPAILKGEMKTYYKYFAQQRDKITPSEIKRLISLYRKEDDEEHKNIIYEVLYDLLSNEREI